GGDRGHAAGAGSRRTRRLAGALRAVRRRRAATRTALPAVIPQAAYPCTQDHPPPAAAALATVSGGPGHRGVADVRPLPAGAALLQLLPVQSRFSAPAHRPALPVR